MVRGRRKVVWKYHEDACSGYKYVKQKARTYWCHQTASKADAKWLRTLPGILVSRIQMQKNIWTKDPLIANSRCYFTCNGKMSSASMNGLKKKIWTLLPCTVYCHLKVATKRNTTNYHRLTNLPLIHDCTNIRHAGCKQWLKRISKTGKMKIIWDLYIS